jgi:hypothetical protein
MSALSYRGFRPLARGDGTGQSSQLPDFARVFAEPTQTPRTGKTKNDAHGLGIVSRRENWFGNRPA